MIFQRFSQNKYKRKRENRYHVTLKPLKAGRANGFGSSRSLNNWFCGLGKKNEFGPKLRETEMTFFSLDRVTQVSLAWTHQLARPIRSGASHLRPPKAFFTPHLLLLLRRRKHLPPPARLLRRRRGLILAFLRRAAGAPRSAAISTNHVRYGLNPEALPSPFFHPPGPSPSPLCSAANCFFAFVWLRWVAPEDYEQEQEMEVEALQAILMDDIKGS